MIPATPKATNRKFKWAFVLLSQAGILLTISCSPDLTEKSRDTKIEIQDLQRKLVEARSREKALKQENNLARSLDPYLVIDFSAREMELKAKGRVLRSFKIKSLTMGMAHVPDAVQVLSEAKPIQKTDRPRLKPGEGEAATIEAAQKMLWGLDRMPQDFDLICRDGMILEIRALPSEESGSKPILFIKTLYQKTLNWYRHWKSSGGTQTPITQIWLDENDSRLLIWSLPKQLKILIIA